MTRDMGHHESHLIWEVGILMLKIESSSLKMKILVNTNISIL